MFSRLLQTFSHSDARKAAASSPILEKLHVVRSTKAKRLALRVDNARARICLVIPKRVSEKKAWEFASQHEDWVRDRLSKLRKPVPFVNGAIIPVFGIDRTIRITKVSGRTTAISLTENSIEVLTPRENPSTNIKRFLIETLEKTVSDCATVKAASIEKKMTGVVLRDTRTRWGSCTHDGRLMLCWRLVFAPLPVIDYVVAHEVAHLRYMDHSRQFWALCDTLSDDMDYAKKWLNENGESLLRFGAAP